MYGMVFLNKPVASPLVSEDKFNVEQSLSGETRFWASEEREGILDPNG